MVLAGILPLFKFVLICSSMDRRISAAQPESVRLGHWIYTLMKNLSVSTGLTTRNVVLC